MTQILLVCNAGMSTSIIAQKMEELGKGEIKVTAVGISDYQENYKDKDILLVGPQIRFQADEIQKNVTIPVMVMNFQKYGLLDAQGILDDAFKVLEG